MKNDSNWKQLEPEQKNQYLTKSRLTKAFKPKIKVQTTEDILKTLDRMELATINDRIEALSGRFDRVLQAAAEEMEPEIQFVSISRDILKTEEEIDDWIKIVEKQLKDALNTGPVMPN